MITKILPGFLALSLLFAIPAQAASANNVYTEKKTNIFVTADQPEFVIQLKSNPTTGYSWFLKDFDSTYIDAEKHSYQADTKSKLIGAGGYEVWTFKIKPPGFVVPHQIALHFIYDRPWEKSDKAPNVTFWVSTQGNSQK